MIPLFGLYLDCLLSATYTSLDTHLTAHSRNTITSYKADNPEPTLTIDWGRHIHCVYLPVSMIRGTSLAVAHLRLCIECGVMLDFSMYYRNGEDAWSLWCASRATHTGCWWVWWRQPSVLFRAYLVHALTAAPVDRQRRTDVGGASHSHSAHSGRQYGQYLATWRLFTYILYVAHAHSKVHSNGLCIPSYSYCEPVFTARGAFSPPGLRLRFTNRRLGHLTFVGAFGLVWQNGNARGSAATRCRLHAR